FEDAYVDRLPCADDEGQVRIGDEVEGDDRRDREHRHGDRDEGRTESRGHGVDGGLGEVRARFDSGEVDEDFAAVLGDDVVLTGHDHHQPGEHADGECVDVDREGLDESLFGRVGDLGGAGGIGAFADACDIGEQGAAHAPG